MLISTVCSAAFYCQRCGRIHVLDIPYFCGQHRMVLQCANCGHEQAVVIWHAEHVLEFRLSCVVCDTVHVSRYPLRRLHRLGLEKVYCGKDHFELGYLGRRRRIEELLAFNEAEFEALHPDDGKHFIEKQQLLLAAVNRVHDIAARGGLQCPCGSHDIAIDIRGNSLVLECSHCGSYYILNADRSGELARLERDIVIHLIEPDLLKKK